MKQQVIDPIRFVSLCWPDITLYPKEVQMFYSVRDNKNTYVPAGHKLGKDFTTALIAIWFFISREPCRVITTSVDSHQLEKVLWGEITNFINTSKFKLPFVVTQNDIKKIVKGRVSDKSYIIGRVAKKGEGMTGHHLAHGPNMLPMVLGILDESSGIDHETYDRLITCTHRNIVVGNPYPCSNFFYTGVEEGILQSPTSEGLERNIIKITAEDSPNVKQGIKEIFLGIRKPEYILIRNEDQPWGVYDQEEYNNLLDEWNQSSRESSHPKTIIPGVLGFYEYIDNRTLWDEMQQCIKLDAEFYKGKGALLFPPLWLDAAERLALQMNGRPRVAKTIGVDSAAGGDNTAWAIIDETGLIELISKKTPDTSIIVGETIALMHRYKVEPANVLFDAGGGGKQHGDRMRAMGHKVRMIGFGESVTPPLKRGTSFTQRDEKIESREERYVFKNRRAEMYGQLSLLLNPKREDDAQPFALHPQIFNKPRPDGGPSLRKQLAKIPLWYDEEGRLFLPPKQRNPSTKENKDKTTMNSLIGCSPDEADALVLAVHGIVNKERKIRVGAI